MLKAEEVLNVEEQKEVLEMRGRGMTCGSIAKHMNEHYYTELNDKDIQFFCNKRKKNAVEILKKKGKFEQEMADQYFQTVTQMNELNQKLWAKYYEIEQNPEYKEKSCSCPFCKKSFKIQLKTVDPTIKIADHLLKQIQHVDKVIGRLKNTNLNVTYNIVDMTEKISKVIPNLMGRYEKQGIIKIRSKKRLREEAK